MPRILTVIILLALSVVRGANSQCPTNSYPYQPDWWHASGGPTPCSVVDQKLTCSPVPENGWTAIITITNKTKDHVIFNYVEYNYDGKQKFQRHWECVDIPSEGTIKIRMLSIEGSLTSRYAKLWPCKRADQYVACAEVVKAEVQQYVGNKQ